MMRADRIIRPALWVSVPFNLIAAYLLASPGSALGQLLGMPLEVPALYSVLLSWLVGMFAGVLAWLAMQRNINRGVVGVIAIGKTGVFMLVALLAISGHATALGLLFTAPDLILAAIYVWWLVKTAKYANR